MDARHTVTLCDIHATLVRQPDARQPATLLPICHTVAGLQQRLITDRLRHYATLLPIGHSVAALQQCDILPHSAPSSTV